ncbi:aminotransferase class V-fold PLP-dependent enzyme [Archangium lipolyticum]|uniref:aminotransferase class V-fold PLP-dependent enzyme n=1 Tax=Archangium lipolyticum TaxID=2970465 RepID=UPI00214A4A5E|nr:aminotransferase class V-fold PLP-dependent enzyme [Archangium lipolyticum]
MLEDWERHFEGFRSGIIGIELRYDGPMGTRPLLYADWMATGRLYGPIEQTLLSVAAPFYGNVHSKSSCVAEVSEALYEESRERIRSALNADERYALLLCGQGMTAAVNKLVRLLRWSAREEHERPVFFTSHLEHHSNLLPWLECGAEVRVVPPDRHGDPDLSALEDLLHATRHRPWRAGAFSACSNVSGRKVDVGPLAQLLHAHGCPCFVDHSAHASHASVSVRAGSGEWFDAVYFSGHKLLGGPGSPGVLCVKKELIASRVPDEPGGGSVKWTDPWGGRSYVDDMEVRESAGTPGVLQAIRLAMALRLKEKMGEAPMAARNGRLRSRLLEGLSSVEGLQLLDAKHGGPAPVVSFWSERVHHHRFARLLSDLHGVQVRSGCSCAGTYGHVLLGIDRPRSREICEAIERDDLSAKPGWVRVSLHPTSSLAEVDAIVAAIGEVQGDSRRHANDDYDAVSDRHASPAYGDIGTLLRRCFE